MNEASGVGRILDISRTVSPALAGWPGDTPYRFEMLCRLHEGASVNLGTIQMSPHTGTHIDAPYHYDDQGKTVSHLPLETYVGRAAVVKVEGKQEIRREDIPVRYLAAPRLLLRTGGWVDSARFPESIPVIAPDVPSWLHAHGVILLGLDVPSVDAIESKDLPNHHALGRHGIAILEGLDLTGVAEGFYDLIALPLKLEGADGCPVRAILRS